MNEKELTIFELTEESIESMVHEIRGQRVMLDYDLARIYGYSTKAFNQQIQRNIERFPDDFMFELTTIESLNILRSQNVTANGISSKRRYNPYAFTEQGIYMLMTVLRGELAIKQSKSLIRLFKRMKDYITQSNYVVDASEIIKLTSMVYEHDKDIKSIKNDVGALLDSFSNDLIDRHYLILDNQRIEADSFYERIYKTAKQSVIVIDDYIGIKTLQLLKSCKNDIQVIISSDNKAKNNITSEYLNDFIKDTGINIRLVSNGNRFHDRYIVIDYKSDNERIYHCGSSSKDAGNKITAVTVIDDRLIYHPLFDELMSESEY